MRSFAEIKRHYGFTGEDERRLGSIRAFMAGHAEGAMEALRGWILGTKETAGFFDDAALRAHVFRMQEAWFQDLFSGSYENAYYEGLIKIGQKHVQASVDAHFMNRAINVIRAFCTTALGSSGSDNDEQRRLLISFNKLLDINLDVITASYIEDAMAALQRLNEELAEKVKERTRELEAARRAAEELSLLDGLTGIPNRRRFDAYLGQELRRSAREKTLLSLIMVDIDFFKLFNDHYGHLAGDDCLKKVAQALAKALMRPADMAARYGGEEFSCILPETDASGAFAVAEHFLERVKELAIPHQHSIAAKRITVSCGIVTLTPSQATTAAEIIGHADELLYQAKAAGRNRIRQIEIK